MPVTPPGFQLSVDRPRSWNGLIRGFLVAAGTCLGYYLAARLGYALTIRPAGVVMWPPAGFLLALLLLLPRRDWFVVLPAAFIGNFAADSVQGLPPLIAAFGATANVLESVVAARAVQWIVGPHVTLNSSREVVALVLGAAVVSNAVTSFAGSLVLDQASGMAFSWGWFVWWAGDGLGMLLVTPVLLAWGTSRQSDSLGRHQVSRSVEALALLCVTGIVASFVISPDPETPRLIEGSRHLVLPMIFLAAFRHGIRGAATAVFLVGAIVAWEAATASGVFAQQGETATQQLLEIYGYLAVTSLSGLLSAAVLTEREMARGQMRESESRLLEMAESIHDAFYVLDLTSGRALYVSPAWASIWGRPIEEGYESVLRREAVHPDDRKIVDSCYDLAAAGKPSQATFRLSRPDGSERWVQSRFFPVSDDRGVVLRIIGASTDITELYLARDQHSRSQRMEALGRLAGGVAHDFNNALTVMMTNSDFLGELVGEGEPKLLVREIREAGDRAAELTKQLLEFSRKQPVTLSTFDVNEVIQRLAGMLNRLIRKNVVLEFELEQLPCPVAADRGQLEQVLVNLVVNARDAMPDGGRLTIRTGRSELDEVLAVFRGQVKPGQYVTVDVSDTGIGMTDEVKTRVFEPFFTTKPPGEGTGLGLATSFGIVAQAKGHLTVYSELGIGSTFRIYLPLSSEQIPAATAEMEIPIRGGDETILLVEDDVNVRRVTMRLLTSLGYRVLEAGDGESALALLRTHGEIALMFTDVVMKGMGGGELAAKAASVRAGLPVLFTSGYVEDRMLEKLLDEKGPQVLRKPFTRGRLARKLRQVIEGTERSRRQP